MSDYPNFLEFMRAEVGPRWVVARTLTQRLKDKGHERAVTSANYAKLKDRWASGHPAVVAAQSIAEPEWRDWLIDAAKTKAHHS